MVSKLLWAALFLTPTVLGAALPEVQENGLDLGRRDEVEIAAAVPLAARAEANVAVVDRSADLEARDDVTTEDADKKKKKKKHHKKKGKKKHHKPPRDLDARDEAELAEAEELVTRDVASDVEVEDADKKKKKKHHKKKGKKKHHKPPRDLNTRDGAELAEAEELVTRDVASDVEVEDADKKKKKHHKKKGKKKHHKPPRDLEAVEEAEGLMARGESVEDLVTRDEVEVEDADKKKKKHPKKKGKKHHKGKKHGKGGPPH